MRKSLPNRRQVLLAGAATGAINRRARVAARPNRHAQDHDLGRQVG